MFCVLHCVHCWLGWENFCSKYFQIAIMSAGVILRMNLILSRSCIRLDNLSGNPAQKNWNDKGSLNWIWKVLGTSSWLFVQDSSIPSLFLRILAEFTFRQCFQRRRSYARSREVFKRSSFFITIVGFLTETKPSWNLFRNWFGFAVIHWHLLEGPISLLCHSQRNHTLALTSWNSSWNRLQEYQNTINNPTESILSYANRKKPKWRRDLWSIGYSDRQQSYFIFEFLTIVWRKIGKVAFFEDLLTNSQSVCSHLTEVRKRKFLLFLLRNDTLQIL